MKRLLPILLLFAALAPSGKAQVQALDTYGGVIATACTDNAAWKIATIGGQWGLCTPTTGNSSGHSHFMKFRGPWQVGGVGGGSVCNSPCNGSTTDFIPVSYNSFTHTGASPKYPASPDSTTNWINAQYQRLKAWGFNGSAPTSFRSCGDASITAANRVPCIEYMQQAANVFQHCIGVLSTPSGSAVCKNIWNMRWPLGFAYANDNSHNVVDAYGAEYASYVSTAYSTDSNITACKNSIWCIGDVPWDSDNFSGGAAGTDFPTDPVGRQWEHDALWMLMSAPHIWLNRRNANSLYTSEVNQTKANFQTFLTTRYGTVAALNNAWNSSYTTLGSSGSQATGISLSGSGTGPYTGTLTVTTCVDRFGVLILSNGVAQGADDGFGNLIGPGVTAGTINYTTGAITGLTFSVTPTTPTANDYHDGWGCGTGFLDEWGGTGTSSNFTPAHNWLPTNLYTVTGMSGTLQQHANFQKDMNDFLEQWGIQFYKPMRDNYHTNAPGKFFITAAIGSVPYRSPGRCPLLKAASDSDGGGTFADILMTSYDGSVAQSNFIQTCAPNMPLAIWHATTANADSDWFAMLGAGIGLGTWDSSTEALRAALYDSDMTNLWNRSPQVAVVMEWSWNEDSFFLFQSNGLVSWRDNPYDGTCDITGSATDPITGLPCGLEQSGWKSYGNFTGPATLTNQKMDNKIAGLLASVASTPTASPVAGTYASAQSVTLSSSSSPVHFCFKINSNVPPPSTDGASGCGAGSLYSGSIPVSATETIYAVAGGTGFADSPVGTFAYTITSPPPAPAPSGPGSIPIIVISHGITDCKFVQPGTDSMSAQICKDAGAVPCLVCM